MTKEGESPVNEILRLRGSIQSTTRHEEPGWKSEGPPSKAKYSSVTDSGEVPWGKGEKNPGRGVKENLKPYVYKQTEYLMSAMSYFL